MVNDMMTKQERIAHISEHGVQAQGKKELVAHLEGKTITLKSSILAKCYDCNGYYSDGKADCQCPSCPLYPLMPYQKGGPRKLKKVSPGEKERLRGVLHKARGS